VRVVVNELTFKEPMSDAIIEAATEVAQVMVDAGGLSINLVQVDETHAILVLSFPNLETQERIKSEIGGPWMREHIVPFLEGSPKRRSGEVVASSR
jgi:hypothetical protein